VALVCTVIGLQAASSPYAYALALDDLDLGRLTEGQASVFKDLGLTPEFFAAYTIALPVGTMVVFTVVGTVIFLRRSEDRMALFSAFMLVLFGGAALTADVPAALAASHPALWFPVHLLDYLGQVAFGVFFYIFPSGRFGPRWTRWLALAVALLFVPTIFFQGSSVDILEGPAFVCFLVSLVAAQVYRYRWLSSPPQRQQTKWVVFAVAVALVGFAALLTLVNVVPSRGPMGPVGEMVGQTLVYGLIALIPLSIGAAILRSGLYDIDLLINRTLVYGSLTAVLVALYFGAIVLLQRLFVVLTGEQSTIAVVASTLAIAALFAPLRRRVQGFVDRRFYRSKYDAAKTLEAFSATLREETDLGKLRRHLVWWSARRCNPPTSPCGYVPRRPRDAGNQSRGSPIRSHSAFTAWEANGCKTADIIHPMVAATDKNGDGYEHGKPTVKGQKLLQEERRSSNPSSSSTGTPSSLAFSSFEPASSPAST
jgi:hypothetical protein